MVDFPRKDWNNDGAMEVMNERTSQYSTAQNQQTEFPLETSKVFSLDHYRLHQHYYVNAASPGIELHFCEKIRE